MRQGEGKEEENKGERIVLEGREKGGKDRFMWDGTLKRDGKERSCG